jgi:hypothetical protein
MHGATLKTILVVLRDLPFSRIQSFKSADDFENKNKNL